MNLPTPSVAPANFSQSLMDILPVENFSGTRREGADSFSRLGFPGSRNEEFRFTPISRQLEKHFKASDFVTSGISDFSNVGQFAIPGLDSILLTFLNGEFKPSLSAATSSAEFSIESLETALENDEEAKKHFGKLVPAGHDAFSALNLALWKNGVFIRVGDNVVVEKPIQILHLHDAQKKPVVSHPRILILLGKGSKLQLIEKYNSVGSEPVFSSCVEEIVVSENATFNYHCLQNQTGRFIHAGVTNIRQHNSSRVNTFSLSLDGDLVRNNLEIIVDGENCESHFYGLYLLDDHTLVDNHTVVDHLKPNSFSNELYKGIMDGSSRGVFNGKVYVRPHAQKTNAFQSNRNILMSEAAAINTKPQLEIWADDVKCSHGCTSGQLDDEALFYLRSRGINRQTARAMVLRAFAGEVLNSVENPDLKIYFDNLVSERLQKKL